MTSGESPNASSDEEPDDCGDLISAAESTLGFWDNPVDDADWNNIAIGPDERPGETRAESDG